MSLKKRAMISFLAVGLAFSMPLQVGATATQKKNEAQQNLDSTNRQIQNLKEEEEQVQAQLSEKGKELSDILVNQEMVQLDITNTEEAMKQAQADLEVAQQKADKQYADMKLRIQFMYENSTSDSFWTAILESKGIADMLNRIEYVQKVEETDRQMLEAYESTVKEIEELNLALEEQHTQLTALKETYDAQQAQVEAIIGELEATAANYEEQIASAQELASSYKKAMEEAETQIKAEEERRRQEQLAQQQQPQGGSGGDASKPTGGSDYTGGSGVNPSPATNVSGQDIVNYALQFVGNPYVWGGNNLETGVDCSGFVNQVYKHFGINTVRYSLSFAYEGQAVSADCMQPGDVIVYSPKNGIGHVGIYIGNGCIVEAQSTAAGITSNRAWNCRDVIAIRRLI